MEREKDALLQRVGREGERERRREGGRGERARLLVLVTMDEPAFQTPPAMFGQGVSKCILTDDRRGQVVLFLFDDLPADEHCCARCGRSLSQECRSAPGRLLGRDAPRGNAVRGGRSGRTASNSLSDR